MDEFETDNRFEDFLFAVDIAASSDSDMLADVIHAFSKVEEEWGKLISEDENVRIPREFASLLPKITCPDGEALVLLDKIIHAIEPGGSSVKAALPRDT